MVTYKQTRASPHHHRPAVGMGGFSDPAALETPGTSSVRNCGCWRCCFQRAGCGAVREGFGECRRAGGYRHPAGSVPPVFRPRPPAQGITLISPHSPDSPHIFTAIKPLICRWHLPMDITHMILKLMITDNPDNSDMTNTLTSVTNSRLLSGLSGLLSWL